VTHIPRDELAKKYLDEGLSFEDCAEHFGCSSSTIENRLHQYDIPTRPPGSEPGEIKETDLRELYVDMGLSTVEIAEMYDCHNSTISSKLKQYGISTEGPNHGNALQIPEEELVTLYVDEDQTTYELAERYNCDPTVIERRLRWYGIETRHTTAGDGEWEYKYGPTWQRQRRKALEAAGYRCEVWE
jgi:transposase